jgi:hypothetical protein
MASSVQPGGVSGVIDEKKKRPVELKQFGHDFIQECSSANICPAQAEFLFQILILHRNF